MQDCNNCSDSKCENCPAKINVGMSDEKCPFDLGKATSESAVYWGVCFLTFAITGLLIKIFF